MNQVLLETVKDGVLTLTMNRPDRLNALNPEMLTRLHDALMRAAADREVAVIVLAGRRTRLLRRRRRQGHGRGRAQRDLRRARPGPAPAHGGGPPPAQDPQPTVAMLRGAAAGAGLSLALACDLRVASDTARLTTAFAKVALSGDFGGSYFLTQLVGPAKARELYFTSPILSAAEAQGLGLVTRIVADAELEDATQALALSLARGPRVTLGYMKQNLNLAERAGLAEVMDAEALRHTRCGQTEDHREAAVAFVEKRAPVFKGR